MICWTKCEPCMFGSHYDRPQWHSWAGPEDIDHAAATGQPDPSTSACGCACSGAAPTAEDSAKVEAAITVAVQNTMVPPRPTP
jgi:hypothetical protein